MILLGKKFLTPTTKAVFLSDVLRGFVVFEAFMKHLGVDYGGKRVGISVSDDSGVVAFPLEEVRSSVCVDRLRELISDRGVAVVVFGESVDSDGTDNAIMVRVRAIANALLGEVRVAFEGEQFSTQAAGRLGKGSDAEAATIILQSYLDRKNRGAGCEEEYIVFD